MGEGKANFCSTCKHFRREMDVDGPGIPWCANANTKEGRDRPICALREDAPACELFEGKENQVLVSQYQLRLKNEIHDLVRFGIRLTLHGVMVAMTLAFLLFLIWMHREFRDWYFHLEQPQASATSHR